MKKKTFTKWYNHNHNTSYDLQSEIWDSIEKECKDEQKCSLKINNLVSEYNEYLNS